MKNLQELNIQDNSFTGTIPTQIGTATSLRTLNLFQNGFGGSLPRQLGNLFQLETLDIQENTFNDELPTTLGNMVSLKALRLNDNGFIGSFPTQLGKLENLMEARMHDNELDGSLPTQVGALTKLTYLTLQNNFFKQNLPTQIGNLVALKEIVMRSNDFTGQIPAQLGNLPLEVLDLSANRFSGDIPASLGGLTTIFVLDLSDNQLVNTVPASFGQLSTLNFLHLQFNRLGTDLNPLFCGSAAADFTLEELESDCSGDDPGTACSCCTLCCNAEAKQCEAAEAAPVNFPTQSPVTADSRFGQLETLLTNSGITPSEKFTDTESPQYKAAWWLASTDPSPLEILKDPFEKVLQRYVMVLLWYATGGENWTDQNNFLGNLGVCQWQIASGARCNQEGLIIELDLGRNNLEGTIPDELGYLQNLVDVQLGMYRFWLKIWIADFSTNNAPLSSYRQQFNWRHHSYYVWRAQAVDKFESSIKCTCWRNSDGAWIA